MDYVDDACMAFFTVGQKTRMHATINGARIGLANNSAACGTTSINYKENAVTMNIFPNPTDKNTVRISIKNNNISNAELKIFDIRGVMLVEGIINQYSDIDISTFNEGIYFVQIIQENKRGIQKLIVKK